MLMSTLTRARIGTSDAAKRMETAHRAAEKARDEEAERRRRDAIEAERAAATERAARAKEAADRKAREREAWARRQPEFITSKARWRDIVEKVAGHHGLTVEELLSHSRVKKFTRPRFEAMYRIYAETPLSYQEIGRRLGGRHYTTVLNGVSRHAALNGLPMPRRDEPTRDDRED